MPPDKLPEPGEFTKIFKRQHLAAQGGGSDAANAKEASSIPNAPEPASAAPSVPPPTPPPAAPAPSPTDEPGEFTRYFTGGALPTPPARTGGNSTGGGTAQRTPSNVQRPNTPYPPRSLTGDSSGSFTARFANSQTSPLPPKAEEYGVQNPRLGQAPDLSKQAAAEENGPFYFKPSVPEAPPASKESASEYTALFGRGNVPPAPRQSAVAPTPPSPMMSDSPRSTTNIPLPPSQLPDISSAPSEKGPSEFTMIASGRQAPVAPSMNGSPSTIDSSRKMPTPVNLNVSPMSPLSSLGAAGGMPSMASSASANMSGAHMHSPLGSVNVQAPQIPQMNAIAGGASALSRVSDQTKLILFFAVLAILSIILVVVLVVTQKN